MDPNDSLAIGDVLRWLRQHRRLSPARLIALSFALAILVGTVLLALPISHAPGHAIGLLDAFFTATSAVCVTGLIVVDTGTAYSVFGRLVIMLLIQMGGLGLITFGTVLALASGRRIGFRERMHLRAQINVLEIGGIVDLIRRILLFVVIAELLGALLLYLRFAPRLGWESGAFHALFHSISAFNNAGFAFYPDSLSPFVTDPLVNFTVVTLIVLGGLGFIVVFNLLARLRPDRRAALSLHSKVVLTATAALIGIGCAVILAFEWTNPATLGPLTVPGKLQAGLFQAITPRTAGFNTLDYSHMRASTLVFTMLLMFVGGSPGSTAGGIKTVTFFVLIASAWSIGRGRRDLVLFKRRIDPQLTVKAGVVGLVGVMVTGAVLTLLALTEAHLDPFALAFEAISAAGTVGLSLGVTGELTVPGKLMIIGLMYLGRLGPLTFALALIERQTEPLITYPVDNVVIG